MMNKFKYIVCVFSIAFFAFCGIASIIVSDAEFSQDENRYLQQLPEADVKSVVNGDYQLQINDYFTDQSIFRSGFMRIYALSQKIMGKNEYNGVYVCDDNWIIEVYNEPENTKSICEKFNKVASKTDAVCTLMLVPTAVSVYDDVLPANVSFENSQRDACDYFYNNTDMTCVDLWDAFEQSKDETQLFYKTDHHWTTDAAYIAYCRYCDSVGIEPFQKSFFDIQTVSQEFFGTTYSKALNAFQIPDKITVYKQDMTGITVTYLSGKGELYAEEYLDKKDKYSYFLNSNQQIVEIENSNISNDRILLVVKDSYANCLVPFLINHYEKVVVLDTRYYRNGVSFAAQNYSATDILFCFNLNTLDTDTAIAGVF